MRNGLLLALIVSCVSGGSALAQPPQYYYPAPNPVVPPSYGPPQVFVGGALQADGPIPLPNRNGPVRPLGTSLEQIYATPQVAPTPLAVTPQPVGSRPAPIQAAGNTAPAPGPAVPPAPDLAGVPSPADHLPVNEPAIPSSGAEFGSAPVAEAPHDLRLPEFPPGYHYYGAVDYLYWWVRRQEAPPLVVLGSPGSSDVLVGDRLRFDNGERQGVRATFGAWLNECQTCGVEASFLELFPRNPHVTVSLPPDVAVSRAFIDATTGLPSGVFLTNPGISTGVSEVSTFSRLWTVEANARMELCRFEYGHLDLLAGFRYLSLDENLVITDNVQFATVPVFLSGANVTTHDFFGTENSFYGGQIGLDAQFHCGRVYFDVWGKLALGDDHQRVLIDGSTVIVAPPAPVGNVTAVGGILAQPTNIGAFNHDRFAVVSEAGVKIGARLTDSIRLGVGYSFLYLNRVVRPGNQIDATVNPTQIPQLFLGPLVGPPRPTFTFRESDYWAHGISVELEYRF